MLAYHSDPKVKSTILKQLRAHAKADQIIRGVYWDGGKGCAVGCTIHSGQHVEYETRFGIPQMLAHIEDAIFEGLPNERAQEWPVQFMSAIEPGMDLSRVGWAFQHWLLTDEKVNPGIDHPIVQDAVKKCAEIMADLAKGKKVGAAAWSAAAWSAESARAAAAARAAWSAARAAGAAAESAGAAVGSAAWSATAARAAAAAWSAAAGVAYVRMADKLIQLLKAA